MGEVYTQKAEEKFKKQDYYSTIGGPFFYTHPVDPIHDKNFREKAQLVDQVSNLANEVTDSMAELQEVNNSILEMKKMCNITDNNKD